MGLLVVSAALTSKGRLPTPILAAARQLADLIFPTLLKFLKLFLAAVLLFGKGRGFPALALPWILWKRLRVVKKRLILMVKSARLRFRPALMTAPGLDLMIFI